MNFNYSDLSDTVFGKFIGCAIMADKELLPSIDMSNVNVVLTVDGKEVDFQRVFTSFERTVVKPTSEDFLSAIGNALSILEDKVRALALSGEQEGRDRRAELLASLHTVCSSWDSSGTENSKYAEIYELLQATRTEAFKAKVG